MFCTVPPSPITPTPAGLTTILAVAHCMQLSPKVPLSFTDITRVPVNGLPSLHAAVNVAIVVPSGVEDGIETICGLKVPVNVGGGGGGGGGAATVIVACAVAEPLFSVAVTVKISVPASAAVRFRFTICWLLTMDKNPLGDTE